MCKEETEKPNSQRPKRHNRVRQSAFYTSPTKCVKVYLATCSKDSITIGPTWNGGHLMDRAAHLLKLVIEFGPTPDQLVLPWWFSSSRISLTATNNFKQCPLQDPLAEIRCRICCRNNIRWSLEKCKGRDRLATDGRQNFALRTTVIPQNSHTYFMPGSAASASATVFRTVLAYVD